MFSIESKVIIVTGSAGDIGFGFCETLAKAGAKMVLADLNIELAETRAEQLRAQGLVAIATQLDVTSEASAAAAAKVAADTFGGIDALVNSAALMKEIPEYAASKIDMVWWRRVIDVNLTGPLICARAVLPYMKQRGKGKIVNIVSGGAFVPSGVYGAGKLGLVSLTASLATELGEFKINVNALAPGQMDTQSGYAARGFSDEYVKALAPAIPLKTLGTPADLVGTLVYLLSPASDWVTGQTVSVDGGWIMRL
jgi:NAD(P)-dependent dehydrogenase (short-subunit alcohol dehydrogenase family)